MLYPFNDQPAIPPDQLLDEAYRNARYLVNDFTLRIGQPHPDFDRWLAQHRHSTYLIVTSHNPASRALTAMENMQLEHLLARAVQERGLTAIPAHGHDPLQRWETERGLCLLDVPREEAHAIGRQFGQNAVVEGERGGAPRLFWLR